MRVEVFAFVSYIYILNSVCVGNCSVTNEKNWSIFISSWTIPAALCRSIRNLFRLHMRNVFGFSFEFLRLTAFHDTNSLLIAQISKNLSFLNDQWSLHTVVCFKSFGVRPCWVPSCTWVCPLVINRVIDIHSES